MKIIRKKNGHINVKSTLKRFEVDLNKRVKEEENIQNDQTIRSATEAVIGETQGFDISHEFLLEAVVRKLFQAGDNYDDVKKRVTQHLRFNNYLK